MLESEAMAILVGAGVSYGRREAALRAAGSALAILAEPGLYAAEEGIGIRLENDILVTEGAPEDLIGDVLLNVDEIEALMGRR